MVLAQIWLATRQDRKPRWEYVGAAAVVAMIVASIWYVPRAGKILNELYFHIAHYNTLYKPLQAQSGEFFLVQGIRELGIPSAVFILAATVLVPIKDRVRLLPIYALFWTPILVTLIAPSDWVSTCMSSSAG